QFWYARTVSLQCQIYPSVRNITEFGRCETGVVQGHGQKLSMKIAPADRKVFIDNNGIVRNRIKFYPQKFLKVQPCIARCPMDLRRTPQGIEVLYLLTILVVSHDLGFLEQGLYSCRHVYTAFKGPKLVQFI